MAKAEKTRNLKTWTDAEFKSRIVSALRKISSCWKPKQACIKKARVSMGKYKCECCGHIVPVTTEGVWKSGKKEGKKRRIKNIVADHISPVVDPNIGFLNWDEYIKRMFIETGWQAICKSCHDKKTKEETAIATKRRKNAKRIIKTKQW